MRFELRQDAAAQNCGTRCRLLIGASGAMTAETPVEFHNFANGRDLTGATVVLDSDGGSVLGAITLGREIRALGLATTVGRLETVVGTEQGVARAELIPVADCESMCAFVLLAGKTRSVPPQARVMVHQIWLGDRREDPTAASYSAEDLVLVQRDVGRLVRYTADMGGPAELVDLALRIPPWEPMHALTPDELRRTQLNLVNEKIAQAAPVENVASALIPASFGRPDITAVSEHGWALIERPSETVMARRHPLTVEGDEIGNFEIELACAGERDSYVVNYRERRGSAAPASNRVGTVTVRVAAYSATLKVISSDPGAPGATATQLTTLASGTVPAALIKAFTAPGNHSLTVATTSPSRKTAIRLGNTGAARNLPAFAASCQNGNGGHAEMAAQKTGGSAQRQ